MQNNSLHMLRRIVNGLVTCIWKRPELTAKFLDYYREKDLIRVCVTSPEDSTADGHDYSGWHRVEYSNRTLSDKFNAGSLALKRYDVEGMFIVGSDDFMNDAWIEMASKHDHAQINGMYFYDEATGRGAFLREAYCGAGRFLSRKVLEACQYVCWPNKRNKSLDHGQTLLIESKGFSFTTIKCTKESEFAVLDIKDKDGTSIWSYDRIMEGRTNNGRDVVPDGNALAQKVDEEHLRRLFGDEIIHSDVSVGAQGSK